MPKSTEDLDQILDKLKEYHEDNKKSISELYKTVSDIRENVHSVNNTLGKQQVILDEHSRRSSANEARVEILTKELDPIKSHVAAFGVAGKVLTALAALCSIIYAIYRMVA